MLLLLLLLISMKQESDFLQKVPFINGDTIFLRGLCPEDAEGNYPNWFNSADICQYNSHHRFPYSKFEAISYIEKLANDRTQIVFAIIEKKAFKHIGNISLQDINYFSRSAEIAFIIGEKEYWGCGIASEAGKLAINHGFKQLNLYRISMGTSAENIGMIRVAERLGFIKEGMRRHSHYKNGRYIDIIEFGLLREEWEVINSLK